MTDVQQDQLYATPQERISRFSFDERVARCFPDMINRSVPGYAQITAMCALIAARHLRAGAHVYDLGCSHGAVSLALCQRLEARPFSLTAVDLSPAMLARARANLAAHCPAAKLAEVELIEGDILTLEYRPAGMIVLNFTLQFLPPERRAALLKRLFDALEPGGMLVLAEKVRFEPEETEREIFALHHDFKRANGYSQLEISQKRSALEEVMSTDTLELHHQRLAAAGFARHFTWFQYLNFAAMLAFKAS